MADIDFRHAGKVHLAPQYPNLWMRAFQRPLGLSSVLGRNVLIHNVDFDLAVIV
jgi:hypothetical protein